MAVLLSSVTAADSLHCIFFEILRQRKSEKQGLQPSTKSVHSFVEV